MRRQIKSLNKNRISDYMGNELHGTRNWPKGRFQKARQRNHLRKKDKARKELEREVIHLVERSMKNLGYSGF